MVKTLSLVLSVMMLCCLVGGYADIWEEGTTNNSITFLPDFVKIICSNVGWT
jgi:hypothetical protein